MDYLKSLEKLKKSLDKAKEDILVDKKQDIQSRLEIRKSVLRRRQNREIRRIVDKYDRLCLIAESRVEDGFNHEFGGRVWGAYPAPKDLINRRADKVKDAHACPVRVYCEVSKDKDGNWSGKCRYPVYRKKKSCDRLV